MLIRADSLDDLLQKTYKKLFKGKIVVASRGSTLERIGALLVLTNPRARLSSSESRGKIFSALGELIWYLSGSDSADHITYYIKRYEAEAEPDGTIHGAYGTRLIHKNGFNQISNVVNLLRAKPTSRRAVIQLFSADDLVGSYAEIPCTCTIQLLVRKDRLDTLVNMRSNDAYWGLPHDVFAFTMLQELIARQLELEVGQYRHFVGSLHLYDTALSDAESYVAEGWQSRLAMPAMPMGDQSEHIARLINFERDVRTNISPPVVPSQLPAYWRDLAMLLRIHRAMKNKAKHSRIVSMMQETNSIYHPYIMPIADRAAAREAARLMKEAPAQTSLFKK
jgi:thymidylate synthase